MYKEKIDFINDKLNGTDPQIPRFLCKYRPFDEYTFDMIENEYLYLCPAKNLDDPSECTVSFSVQDYADIDTCLLNIKCIDLIIEIMRQYSTEENFNHSKEIIYNLIDSNGYIRNDWLIDASFELEKLAPKEVVVNLVNWLANIPKMLDDSTIRPQVEKLFLAAYNAREEIGICSLTPINNAPQMWTDYACNETGYCIEYDMTEYTHNNLIFPVIYQNDRQNNILITILSDFVAQSIFGISSGKLSGDRSNYIRMFLTKDTKWDYQQEWRILGNGNTKIKSPNISAIHLGKNVSFDNKQAMLEYCKQHNIICKTST